MSGRRAAVAAFLIGLLVIVGGVIGGYDREAGGQRSSTGALSDYRDALYQPVRALARGVNPYDHEAYLATMAVDQELPPYFPLNYGPFAPLVVLPLPVAGATFVALSIGAVLATGAVVAAAAGERGPRAATVALAFGGVVLLSRPGFQALQYGQSGPWVALCLA
ncbi:MAG: DUF2029 domain-containing protein, partial [Acidimicrobiales bacterium]|nr:DUF2029 domain-containing protein [Acidimicrobiales bacterium]